MVTVPRAERGAAVAARSGRGTPQRRSCTSTPRRSSSSTGSTASGRRSRRASSPGAPSTAASTRSTTSARSRASDPRASRPCVDASRREAVAGALVPALACRPRRCRRRCTPGLAGIACVRAGGRRRRAAGAARRRARRHRRRAGPGARLGVVASVVAPRVAGARSARAADRSRGARSRGRDRRRHPSASGISARSRASRVRTSSCESRTRSRPGSVLDARRSPARAARADGRRLRRAHVARAAGCPRGAARAVDRRRRAARRRLGRDRRHPPQRPRRAARRRAATARRSPTACCSAATTASRTDTRDAFRASGLGHLLAVSGQNVVLLVAAVVVVCGWLGIVARARRSALAIAATILYVLVVGPGASVVRAGITGVVVALAWLANRPVARWHVLSVAAAGCLWLDPWAVLEPGFQLSFAAVVAIFVAAPRMRRWLEGTSCPARLREPLAISTRLHARHGADRVARSSTASRSSAASRPTSPRCRRSRRCCSSASPRRSCIRSRRSPRVPLAARRERARRLPGRRRAARRLARRARSAACSSGCSALPVRVAGGDGAGAVAAQSSSRSSPWRVPRSGSSSLLGRRHRDARAVRRRCASRSSTSGRGTRPWSRRPGFVGARRRRAPRRARRAAAARARGRDGSTRWCSRTRSPTTSAAPPRCSTGCRSGACSIPGSRTTSSSSSRRSPRARRHDVPSCSRGAGWRCEQERSTLRVLGPRHVVRGRGSERGGGRSSSRSGATCRVLLPADAESPVELPLDPPTVDVLEVAHHGSDDPGAARAPAPRAAAPRGHLGRRGQHLRPSRGVDARRARRGGRAGRAHRPRRAT